jgi:hypothetical protein
MIPLIPALIGGGAALYAWWKGSSAAEAAIETATYATKIANDFAIVWNKPIPADVWSNPTAITALQALWSELQALYTRFQSTIKPYAPGIDASVYELFRKGLLNLTSSDALNLALKPIEQQVQDIAKRFENVCPQCGKVATTSLEDSKPTSLLTVAVYGGLAFGAGYLALEAFKAVKHDDTYPRKKLPRYAGGK